MDLFEQLHTNQQNNTPVALCTIIESKGSTPRKAGTKMLVYSSGKIFGTIGGGAFEQMVIQNALQVLAQNKPNIFEFDLQPDLAMNCGGFIKVFIEPIIGKAQLYIFGAGHIGCFLAQLAFLLDFSVTLIDNRPEVLEHISEVRYNKIAGDYLKSAEQLTYNENTFICIVTQNHESDKNLVAYCATKPHCYLGMLGSKNKIAKIKADFQTNSTLTTDQMEQINWPMGIAIAGQTPKEIAVSILAKIVDVRAQNS